MRRRVVAGGSVVTPEGVITADVAIERERIVEIGPGLARDGAQILDASDCLVLPGVIDVHTHLRLEDREHPRRFHQDTLSAARGGTTTALTFNNPGTGITEAGSRSVLAGLTEFRDRTDGRAAVDIALNAVLTGDQPDVLAELPALISAGVPTFKAFMVYDFRLPDDQLEAAMRVAAGHGGMLQVHCEDPHIIDPLIADALDHRRVRPRFHATTRPPQGEAVATRRAIEMARRAGAAL